MLLQLILHSPAATDAFPTVAGIDGAWGPLIMSTAVPDTDAYRANFCRIGTDCGLPYYLAYAVGIANCRLLLWT